MVLVGDDAGVELPGVAGAAEGVVGVELGVPPAGGAGVTTGVFVGAELVGVVAATAATRIAKGARLAVALPSETLIAMSVKSPTSVGRQRIGPVVPVEYLGCAVEVVVAELIGHDHDGRQPG